jgi:hypothetical protein
MKKLALASLAFVASLVLSCTGRPTDLDEGTEGEGEAPLPEPDLACPGAPSCSETLVDDELLAGAAKRVVTPTGFEIANARYLNSDRPNYCAPEAPRQGAEALCGELHEDHLEDCGRDGVCPAHEGYTGPDADGSERDDDDDDWFFDCGLDRLCPDNVPEPLELRDNGFDDDGDGAIDDADYPGADEGEADGEFQGLWIAGYGNSRPALGVKDDLTVRAIVFRQGDSTWALLTLDAVGLFYDEQERIRAKLEALRPGEVDALFVQSTHTHEAPDTMGQWGYADPYTELQYGHGRSDDHMELIRTRGAEAVAEAVDNLLPAQVRVGVVNKGVTGLVRDSRDPKIFNDAITGISVEEKDTGAVIATLLSWGNHPEILDSRNNFISSDFVGPVNRALEDGLPTTADFDARPARGGVGIYIQGAVGGLMGPNGFPINARDGTVYESDFKTWARANAYGELIAERGLEALDDAPVMDNVQLRFSAKSYIARVENKAFHVGLFSGWFDRALYEFDRNEVIGEGNLPHLKTAVGLVFLGDLAFVTAPGELFPETFVGFDPAQSFGAPTIDDDNENPPDLSAAPTEPTLKDMLGVQFAVALGLCQDETGYLVPPYDFKLADPGAYIDEPPGDHYEETNSIGPDAVPLMLENLDVLFDFERARAN